MSVGQEVLTGWFCVQVTEDAAAEDTAAVQGAEEELLPCPICFKTCTSRLDLDAHMDTHPDTTLRYQNLLPVPAYPQIPAAGRPYLKLLQSTLLSKGLRMYYLVTFQNKSL